MSNNKVKMFILMRGHPGAGKSTKANQIRNAFSSSIVHSTDFYWSQDGQYSFDWKKLEQAHKWTLAQVCCSMIEEIEVVVLDNTNIKKEHYQPYLDKAQKYGYDVFQVVCSGSFNNVHGVPVQTVERMKVQFEPDQTIPSLEM